MNYIPEKCGHCEQTITYPLTLDSEAAEIVEAIRTAVVARGVNCVHPRRELENVSLSSNNVGNLSRARFHGLIAHIKGKPGFYCLTEKGGRFLNNQNVWRTVIIRKGKGNVGYYEQDGVVSISELIRGKYHSFDYDVIAGNLVPRKEKVEQVQLFQSTAILNH